MSDEQLFEAENWAWAYGGEGSEDLSVLLSSEIYLNSEGGAVDGIEFNHPVHPVPSPFFRETEASLADTKRPFSVQRTTEKNKLEIEGLPIGWQSSARLSKSWLRRPNSSQSSVSSVENSRRPHTAFDVREDEKHGFLDIKSKKPPRLDLSDAISSQKHQTLATPSSPPVKSPVQPYLGPKLKKALMKHGLRKQKVSLEPDEWDDDSTQLMLGVGFKSKADERKGRHLLWYAKNMNRSFVEKLSLPENLIASETCSRARTPSDIFTASTLIGTMRSQPSDILATINGSNFGKMSVISVANLHQIRPDTSAQVNHYHSRNSSISQLQDLDSRNKIVTKPYHYAGDNSRFNESDAASKFDPSIFKPAFLLENKLCTDPKLRFLNRSLGRVRKGTVCHVNGRPENVSKNADPATRRAPTLYPSAYGYEVPSEDILGTSRNTGNNAIQRPAPAISF